MIYAVERNTEEDSTMFVETLFCTTRKAEAEKMYKSLKAETPGIYTIEKISLTPPKGMDAETYLNFYLEEHDGNYPSLEYYMPDNDWDPYFEIFETEIDDSPRDEK